MTPLDYKTLEFIIDQAKGWSVGIPVTPYRAKRLVSQGYARYAPCPYIHLLNKQMFPICPTTSGIVQVKITARNKRCKEPTMQTLKTKK